jgi:hypothetical protein
MLVVRWDVVGSQLAVSGRVGLVLAQTGFQMHIEERCLPK